MQSRSTRLALIALAGVLVLALAACGSKSSSSTSTSGSSTSSSSSSGKYNAAVPVSGQKKGGTLKVISNEGFDHLDPGAGYFQLTYMVLYAVHRSLYYYKPQDSTNPIPDLAASAPAVSSDGKTVTIKIKQGIKYGTVTPSSINGKEVTSADVKYALERGFNPHVANGYLGVYFPFVGAKNAKGGPISGITTPDKYTVVLQLTSNFGATTAKALTMPITIPVPKSYAAPMDAKNPSGYDSDPTKQAFSGPYMISEYSPGKSITLIRNPEWNASTDSRPAYVDKIVWTMGADPNVFGRQIYNGSDVVNGDTPAAPVIKQFATQKPGDISFTPYGNRFVSLNYRNGPFKNVNVRKAAAAVLDRTAMQRVRGGPVVGDIATHFLPPGLPGFDQAGGMKGTGADFLANPNGNLQLAESYMKKGGYPSGKAPGTPLRLVGDNSSPGKEDALIVQNSLQQLGFKVKPTLVEHSVMYTKFCNVEKQLNTIDVCSNYGWLPDFNDPYAMLVANFDGTKIVPVNNSNPSLFDSQSINAAMAKGSTIADNTQRAQEWGTIDKDLTDNVAAIPWFWDHTANIQASNVQGVIAKWNAAWDLSYVSLK
jgi:peptide/nickel transport system substrate-binding protein